MKVSHFTDESNRGASLLTGRRALSIVERVAQRRGGLSFSELAVQTGLSAASLTRLLKMLVDEDWLHHHSRDAPYSVGSRLLQLADGLRVSDPGIEIAAPVMRRLSARLQHSACIAAIREDHFVLSAKAERRDSYHFIDLMTPNLDWIDNGIGQVLLAFQPDAIAEEIYARHYQRALFDADRARFARIRSDRFLSREEGHVTRIIAALCPEDAPVTHVLAVAALTASRPDSERLLHEVQQAAREIEDRLNRQSLKLSLPHTI